MKMFGNRLELTLRLHLDGDLHIGAGFDKPDEKLLDEKGRKAGNKPPEVALVQRNAGGSAVIPATSLKGALRSRTTLVSTDLDVLLGEQGDAEAGEGRIGRLWLGCAIAEPAPDPDTRFAGATKNGGTRDQGFVKTAVRIDRKSGAAADKLLYNREMIGAGTKFTTAATLFLDDADEKVLVQLLVSLLAPLASDRGLGIGAHQRQAGARLRLDGVTAIRRKISPATLGLKSEDEFTLEIPAGADAVDFDHRKSIRLTLTCDGPFISMRDKVKENDEPEITQPLTQPDNKPRLWPSSLLGALRSRAAWLAECQRLRTTSGQPAPGVVDDLGKTVLGKHEAAALSPVERLFGVAGWRGLMSVASLQPTAGCPIAIQKLTSVTIDRFTGGGIDERLFNELVFVGAAFVCDLELDNGRGVTPEDNGMLKTLLADIQSHGLELGHGGSKGFGWFDVKVQPLAASGGTP